MIKTDIRFILAAGGREDLFSEVTVGVLWGCLFVFLSDTGRYQSLIFRGLKESAADFRHRNHNPIKHHLQMAVTQTD